MLLWPAAEISLLHQNREMRKKEICWLYRTSAESGMSRQIILWQKSITFLLLRIKVTANLWCSDSTRNGMYSLLCQCTAQAGLCGTVQSADFYFRICAGFDANILPSDSFKHYNTLHMKRTAANNATVLVFL